MRRETFYFFFSLQFCLLGYTESKFYIHHSANRSDEQELPRIHHFVKVQISEGYEYNFSLYGDCLELRSTFFFLGRSILLLTLELPDCSDSENQIDFVNFIIVFKLSVDSVISYFLNVDGLTFSIPPMFVNGILALLFKILLFFNYSQH